MAVIMKSAVAHLDSRLEEVTGSRVYVRSCFFPPNTIRLLACRRQRKIQCKTAEPTADKPRSFAYTHSNEQQYILHSRVPRANVGFPVDHHMSVQSEPVQILLVNKVRVLLVQKILQLLTPSNMLLMVVAIEQCFFEHILQPAVELLEF